MKFLPVICTVLAVVSCSQAQTTSEQPSTVSLEITESLISFFISNRASPNEIQVSLQDSVNIDKVSQFNTSLDTIVVIHGWHSNRTDIFNNLTKEAYLAVRDVNIINVDWDELSTEDYITAYNAVPKVGLYVAQFIQNISTTYDYSLDKFTLVGHSLGAHISGYAGQYTNNELPIIIGLDPAGPLFLELLPDTRLSKDDAKYVQAIHTNSGLFGTTYDVGHADFWPNGGSHQPGCILDVTAFCSHLRSFYYFAESVRNNNNNNFFSRQCESYLEYLHGSCSGNTAALMGGAYVNTS